MARSVDPKLLQKIIKFQLELRRLQAGERRKVLNIFKLLGVDTTKVIGGEELASFSKAKLNKLLKDLEEPVKGAYEALRETTTASTNVIAEVQLRATSEALNVTGVITTGVSAPSNALVNRLSIDPLVKGSPLSAWWNKQQAEVQFRLSATLREGILLGQNNQQIVQRIIGTPASPGLLLIARNQANSLVHTATHTVANDAQQAVYTANADVIPSLIWFTALDSHVCPLCAARADKSWRNTPNHEPIGHDISYQIPPIHFNDRCILLPEMEDLGLPVGERASSLGPIKGDTTFKQYLDMVPHEQLEKQLGKGRAALYKAGDISLTQLIDGTGRELTLKQLKDKYL